MLRSIATITQHSRQKVTEMIKLAEKRGVIIPLDKGITDPWLEDFLYPENTQDCRYPIGVQYSELKT